MRELTRKEIAEALGIENGMPMIEQTGTMLVIYTNDIKLITKTGDSILYDPKEIECI